jgi:hypothetical protein
VVIFGGWKFATLFKFFCGKVSGWEGEKRILPAARKDDNKKAHCGSQYDSRSPSGMTTRKAKATATATATATAKAKATERVTTAVDPVRYEDWKGKADTNSSRVWRVAV